MLDILQSAPILNLNCRLIGTNNFWDTADSDVVVITAGASRKPGMTRDELLLTNSKIVTEVAANVARFSPNSIIVMVTNPVDAMTYLALKVSRFPPNRVLGLSGVLDGARLASFVAAELGVPAAQVSACVLGEHGQHMVVIPRLSCVGGTPITKLLPRETIERLVDRTVKGGAEIVGLLKTGSAFYAPSAALIKMVEAIVLDKKEILPCAAYLQGEYGIKDTVIGVPVRLGKSGIEQVLELELTEEEKKTLATSAEAVKRVIERMKLS